MFWIRPVAAVLAVFASVIPSCRGHSTARNPIDYVSIVEDPVLVSPAHRVHSQSRFDLTFLLHSGQQKIKLSLEPNSDLLPDSIKVRRRLPDGSVVDAAPIDRKAHKVFRGTAYVQRVGRSGYREAGWARITVNRDGEEPVFVGAFQVDGDNHHVQTAKAYRELKHPGDPEIGRGDDDAAMMVVWRDSDVVREAYTGRKELRRDVVGAESCSADALPYNAQYKALDTRNLGRMHSLAAGPGSASGLFGRQIDGSSGSGSSVNLINNIGSTVGCPTTRKVALMGVATDCTYTATFDSEQDVRSNIIDQVNLASEVYEKTFNISLGIQTLEISDAECPATAASDAAWNVACGTSTTISNRLNLFSQWRGTKADDANAYWTLLSTCNTGSAVGLAWLGQLCVAEASQAKATDGSTQYIAGANVVVKTSTEWQVLAHEIGHTFGAVHDCISTTCAGGGADNQSCCPLSSSTCDAAGAYMMNPSTGENIQEFSPCSIGNICGALNLGATRSDCLADNKGVTTITGSQCGNGIVESGEDCDCGGEDECGDNSCCDATTCKFIGDAVCDPSNEECCTSSCQLASKGTVCRASTGACDPAETCAGSTSSCPTNAHSPDGDSCGTSLTCASGQCTSRDLQCRSALGTNSSDSSTTSCSDTSVCYMCCDSASLDPSEQNTGQAYLDGTPCENDGKCYSGSCTGSSVTSEIAQWFRDHKNILIPVGASVGGLLVLGILFCCIRSCRRKSKAAKLEEASKWSPSQQQQESWQAYGGGVVGVGGREVGEVGEGGGQAGTAWRTGPPGIPVVPPPPPPPRPAMTAEQMQHMQEMREAQMQQMQQVQQHGDGMQDWRPPHRYA